MKKIRFFLLLTVSLVSFSVNLSFAGINDRFTKHSLDDLFAGNLTDRQAKQLLNTRLSELSNTEIKIEIYRITNYMKKNGYIKGKVPKFELHFDNCYSLLGRFRREGTSIAETTIRKPTKIQYYFCKDHTYKVLLSTVLHELGHVNNIYDSDSPFDSTNNQFSNICRNLSKKGDTITETKSCPTSAFVGSYAQVSSTEDYAETFKYYRLRKYDFNIGKDFNPENPQFQKKLQYFQKMFDKTTEKQEKNAESPTTETLEYNGQINNTETQERTERTSNYEIDRQNS